MPKLKTNKSAKKRFKLTKTGKVRRNKAYAGHLMSAKSARLCPGLFTYRSGE